MSLQEQRVISLLGLAQRAGRLISGEVAVRKAMQQKKVELLLIAADASANTRKSYQDAAAYYGVTYILFSSKLEMGEGIGKAHRAAVALTDKGYAARVQELVRQSEMNMGVD